MSVWEFRLAGPDDAAAFSKWIGENQQIPDADKLAALKTNNPTILWFVETKDGVAQTFAPVYLQFAVPHLGFNPDADSRDIAEGMQRLTDGIAGFAVQFGIREIVTLSEEKLPMARWAMKHDFDLEKRQTLKLNLNKVMAGEVK
jgi:hypothetical protein